jgi:glycosyltransferase involved in cell wall biosynthesis
VVGEGIDVVALERVAKEVRGGTPPGPDTAAALEDLDALLARLPEDRRSLPLALSVGRLAPVKGMATLVSAWLADPALRRRCNLLVVGGDLDDPNPEEAAELSRIREALDADESGGAGLLLAGHRPNATTTAWLAAAHAGRPGACAPGGVYVCASLKEEFGIAIVEAIASGLVVVAPRSGGPATFVEDGLTGVLADTASAGELTAAVRRALGLAGDEVAAARAEVARRRLRRRVGIEGMAAALDGVYRAAVAAHRGGGPGGAAAAGAWTGGTPMTWTAR